MKTAMIALMLVLATALSEGAEPAAVRCGQLFDVRAGKVLTNQIVIFENGKITKVEPGTSAVAVSTMTPIDLSAATCLPGLINVHTHLTTDPTDVGYTGLGVSVPRSTVKGVKNARLTLRAGFTTVRNVGARGFSDVALRDGIDAGDIEGPRMLVSGPALGITGGHCDNNLLPAEFLYIERLALRMAPGRFAPKFEKSSSMVPI